MAEEGITAVEETENRVVAPTRAAATEDGEEGGERKSKRARKSVDPIYVGETPKEKVKIVIEKGKGQLLGDIPIIEQYLKKKKADDLKPLHSLLFGRKGAAKTLRANIRNFSGIVAGSDSSKQDILAKKRRWMEDQPLRILKSIGEAFGVHISGTKDTLITRIEDFIVKPTTLRDVPAKKVHSKKSTPKKGTPKKALSARDWYCKERRPAQAAHQKDKSPSEITAILESMWEHESAESQKRYETMAKSYAKRMESKTSTKAKSTKKKSPKATSKTKTTKAIKVKKSKEIVTAEDEEDDGEDDDNDDDEEGSEDGGDAEPTPTKKSEVASEDEDSEDEPQEDDGAATGLKQEELADLKQKIRHYINGQNREEVTSKRVRKHVVEVLPDLDMTAEVKDFIKNMAVYYVNSTE